MQIFNEIEFKCDIQNINPMQNIKLEQWGKLAMLKTVSKKQERLLQKLGSTINQGDKLYQQILKQKNAIFKNKCFRKDIATKI